MRHQLTIVCGNAGTGKTTFGKQLAAQSGAFFLDIDTVSEQLVRAGLAQSGRDPNDRDSPDFKAAYRAAIHETLFAIADENLSQNGCIIVAPFTKERRTPEFPKTVEGRLRCPVNIIFVWCEEAERRARIIQRGNPRDASKIDAWDAYSEDGKDPELRPPFPHQYVNTTSRSA